MGFILSDTMNSLSHVLIGFTYLHKRFSCSFYSLTSLPCANAEFVEDGGSDLKSCAIRNDAFIIAILLCAVDREAILSLLWGSGLVVTSRDGTTGSTSSDGTSSSRLMMPFTAFVSILSSKRALRPG